MIDVDMTVADRPGACNIGPAEIARRRRSAVVVTGVAAVAAAFLVLGGGAADRPARHLPPRRGRGRDLAPGDPALLRRVRDGRRPELRFARLDRAPRTIRPSGPTHRNVALRMIVEGVVYGAIATGILVLLPV